MEICNFPFFRENQLLVEAVQQLTEKQNHLQEELSNSDQLLTAARTELENLKATVTKLKADVSLLDTLSETPHWYNSPKTSLYEEPN